jgi:hypothetical protein
MSQSLVLENPAVASFSATNLQVPNLNVAVLFAQTIDVVSTAEIPVPIAGGMLSHLFWCSRHHDLAALIAQNT